MIFELKVNGINIANYEKMDFKNEDGTFVLKKTFKNGSEVHDFFENVMFEGNLSQTDRAQVQMFFERLRNAIAFCKKPIEKGKRYHDKFTTALLQVEIMAHNEEDAEFEDIFVIITER